MSRKNLKLTFAAWPVITLITIGICFLTQQTAKLLGIEIPDQQNVELVRRAILGAFKSSRHFIACCTTLSLVVIVMPVVEEFVFRYLLFRLPGRFAKSGKARAYTDRVLTALSSVIFSAAHYISQPFPDSAFIALFFFGVAQCVLYAKTGGIIYVMITHMLFNLTNIALLLAIPQS